MEYSELKLLAKRLLVLVLTIAMGLTSITWSPFAARAEEKLPTITDVQLLGGSEESYTFYKGFTDTSYLATGSIFKVTMSDGTTRHITINYGLHFRENMDGSRTTVERGVLVDASGNGYSPAFSSEPNCYILNFKIDKDNKVSVYWTDKLVLYNQYYTDQDNNEEVHTKELYTAKYKELNEMPVYSYDQKNVRVESMQYFRLKKPDIAKICSINLASPSSNINVTGVSGTSITVVYSPYIYMTLYCKSSDSDKYKYYIATSGSGDKISMRCGLSSDREYIMAICTSGYYNSFTRMYETTGADVAISTEDIPYIASFNNNGSIWYPQFQTGVLNVAASFNDGTTVSVATQSTYYSNRDIDHYVYFYMYAKTSDAGYIRESYNYTADGSSPYLEFDSSSMKTFSLAEVKRITRTSNVSVPAHTDVVVSYIGDGTESITKYSKASARYVDITAAQEKGRYYSYGMRRPIGERTYKYNLITGHTYLFLLRNASDENTVFTLGGDASSNVINAGSASHITPGNGGSTSAASPAPAGAANTLLPVLPTASQAPAVGTAASVNNIEYEVVSDNTVKIVSYAAKSQGVSVTIPATVNIGNREFHVTAIENGAFSGSKKLKTVTIGKNVTKIGANAFKNCSKLKKVVMKTTKLTKIGSHAFKGCKKAKFIFPSSKKKAYKKMIKKARK